MSRLPFLISVPHAGLTVPPEVMANCILTPEQVEKDGDEGAREIYAIENEVQAFVTTEVARAIIDQNRAEDDRRPDGVVKTHTCWNELVYDPFPQEEVIELLLDRYYRPYHRELAAKAGEDGLIVGFDCHTMAAVAPPIGPDRGERPYVCLSNGDGTCPEEWILGLAESFGRFFDGAVKVNEPFRGGYITRSQPGGLPWIQIELSRAPFASDSDKREAVLDGLRHWYEAS